MLGIAGGIVVCAALGAMAWASVFGHLCDDFSCGGQACRNNYYSGYSDVCCENSVHGYGDAICSETHSWACDMQTKKLLTLVVSFICAIVSITASSCGCAASCCCPSSFEELAVQQPAGGAPVAVVGAVVGQPVGGGEPAKGSPSTEENPNI
jgi:hypothetical protein